jgi:hypothetical protein
MPEWRRVVWLGAAVGVVQSLDFLRERVAGFDVVPNSLAVPGVVAVSVTLWILAGRRSGSALRGARAGLCSGAVTTLVLWATMLLSGRAAGGYAYWHAVAFLGFGLVDGALGAVLAGARRRQRAASSAASGSSAPAVSLSPRRRCSMW